MNLPRFGVLALYLPLVLGNGCRNGDTSAKDAKGGQSGSNTASPNRGAIPKTGDDKGTLSAGLDVPELLRKGGKNWSAPATAPDLDPFEETAGDRFWIWPSEDKVIKIKASDPKITLAWRLRPGQRAVDAAEVKGVMAEIRGKTPGTKFGLRGSTEGLNQGVAEGKCIITPGMAIRDYRGEGELLLFLTVKGIKPASNLLRVRANIVD